MDFGLAHQTVLITGAAGGIGRGLANAFAQQQAHLVLLDREAEGLAQLAKTLQGCTEVQTQVCDLSSDRQVQDLADAVQHAGIQTPFAAAVNLQFVPRTQYALHLLHQNDQIELIAPITGG